jgi:long-chain acyl-CoA synthetase
VVKGDRIALCLPNTPYYIVLYFAALKIGAVVVNLNPLYTPGEMRHF